MTKQSEAIVLRTYPLREADLLVTLFTRAEGKVKGVAKAAKKSKRRFGGALEPLTLVRAYWEDREKQELARVDACEVLESPLSDPVDYPRAAALAHVAEVLDELLPDREANDAVFRLAVSVLGALREAACSHPSSSAPLAGSGDSGWGTRSSHPSSSAPLAGSGDSGWGTRSSHPSSSASLAGSGDSGWGTRCSVWMPLTYFDLWMLRLMGFLPELGECIACGAALNESRAFYHGLADGLMCAAHKRLASREISAESRAIAAQMFRAPVESLRGAPWPKERGADLRRFLVQTLERHLEKKLATVGILEKM